MSDQQTPHKSGHHWMSLPPMARTAALCGGVGGVMLGLILGYSLGFDYGKKSGVNLSSYTPPAIPAAAGEISTSNLVFGKWRKSSGTCPDYLTLSLSDGKLSYVSSSSADGG